MNEILILSLFSIYNVILAYKHVLQLTEGDLRVQGKPVEARIKSKLRHKKSLLNYVIEATSYMVAYGLGFTLAYDIIY